MMEMLTMVRTSFCKNCGKAITLYASDMRTSTMWSHDETGQQPCEGAPMAVPYDTHIDNTPIQNWTALTDDRIEHMVTREGVWYYSLGGVTTGELARMRSRIYAAADRQCVDVRTYVIKGETLQVTVKR